MTDDQQLRRLVLWNRFWLSIVILLATAWVVVTKWNEVRALRVDWTSEGLRFYSVSDGPFVVTHVSKVARSEGEKATAPLLPPIAIVDSAGATLSKSEYAKLKWHDYLGQPLASPAVGTPLVGFYYKPLVTKLPK